MPDFEYTVFPVRKRVIKVTITNNQSTATTNPHVQEIKITHDYLLALLGVSIDPYVVPLNTIFYDPQANAQAYSWYDSFDGTYHKWFVKTLSIGANSTYTLYMIIDIMQQLVDGKYAGINAIYGQNYLGLSYGQYDNGKNVFLLYDNFAGTTLSSIWSKFGSGSIAVNNGLTITVASGKSATGIFTSLSSVPSTGVISRTWAIATSAGSSGGNDYGLLFGNNVTTSGMGSANGYWVSWWGYGNTKDSIFKMSSGSSTALVQASDSVILNKLFYSYFMWYYTNQSNLYSYEADTGVSLSASDTTYNLSAINQFSHFVWVPSSGTSTYTTYSIAIFDAPPNGIMPVVSFASMD
jgi:hypothetical protein